MIDTDVYRLTDLSIAEIEPLTVSITELKPEKHTRGHRHLSPEIYAFFSDALIQLGNNTYEVKAGQMVLIKSDVFHKVYTSGKQSARFASFFWGARADLKPSYDMPVEVPAS